ncbi:MAG: hypothetical protein CMQ13_07025 [Gammaproteobacteria bacterium]|nr:hypothetical protein [Gammaproteobacteria bacterium]
MQIPPELALPVARTLAICFFSGGYTAGDVELGLSIPDVEFFHLGGGVHGPIISAIDWVIAVEYGLAELSRDGFSEDVEGYIANLGIRGLLGDSFEYSLAVIQSDLSGPTNGFEAGARYHFGKSPVSLRIGLVHHDGGFEHLEVGVRYQFD